MEKDFIIIKDVQSIEDILKILWNRVVAKNSSKMEKNIRDSILRGSRMDMVNMYGQTETHTKDAFLRVRVKVKEFWERVMEMCIKDSLNKI
jgi:hypothetical protein